MGHSVETIVRESIIYMFQCHQVVEQEYAFTSKQFPDCIAPSPLTGGNVVTVTCVLADDVSPMSVLCTHSIVSTNIRC